jgi:predicted exporter
MTVRTLYLALCAAGTVLPYSQLIAFVREHGVNPALVVEQLFANRISAFFGLDVIVSAVVLWTFVAVEGRRRRMGSLWMPVAASLTVGVSLGFPLFLYLRERHGGSSR